MYKAIDLFAGIGGIRKGFELTNNVEIVLSAEIDKYACQTYKHLYGEDPLNDVTSEEFKQKVMNIDYDILLGGFPCQAFSIAGKKEGFKDITRGTLFFEIADILECLPDLVECYPEEYIKAKNRKNNEIKLVRNK